MLTAEDIRVQVCNGFTQPDLTHSTSTGCQVKATPNHLSGLTSTQEALGNMVRSRESHGLYIKFGHKRLEVEKSGTKGCERVGG